jgi:DNA-binding HxlR family transcriptional regulator
MTKQLTPQAGIILSHLRRAGSITQREAILDHSIQSLTRRITELNDKGYRTKREDRHHPLTGQRYARYSLASA